MNLTIKGLFFLTLLFLGKSSLEGEVASVKAMGMGYTGVAYPQDALAGAYNPAGMGWIGNRFDIGGTGKRYDGEVLISGNQIINPNEPTNGNFTPFKQKYFGTGDVGFNQQFSAWETPFTLGIMGYERNFWHTTYKNDFFLLGTSNLECAYENYVVAPVFAVKIQNHTIGVSVNFEWSYFKLNGLQKFALEDLSVDPKRFSNNGGNNSWGVTGTVGWQWRVFDCFWVGIAFQPQTPIKKFTRYSGFLAEHGRLNSPQIFSAGFAVKPWREVTFTFDYEIYKWRDVAAMANSGEPALIDAIELDREFSFGMPFGPGFGWKNQTALKFGFDWEFCDCFIIRAGYRFRNTPIRSSQTFLNMLTLETVNHTVTCGMTFAFANFHEFSFYYAHGFEGHVNGDSFSIPSFFGAGRVNLKSHFNYVGLAYGWNW